MSKVKFKIKKGDRVEVITGNDSGKQGEVLSVNRATGRVVVQGVNIMKNTLAKSQENPNGGLVENEVPVHISNVVLLDKSGNRTKVGIKLDGDKRVRYAKKSGDVLDK